MNEFDAWYKILEEWKKIKRTKRLIQELYEQVGGTLFFILDYAKKMKYRYRIVIPYIVWQIGFTT
ncbi:MAG: hypothetical protein WBE68_16990 [Candidatus Nitrosopolaris sp.]|jgi:hypothetical protein